MAKTGSRNMTVRWTWIVAFVASVAAVMSCGFMARAADEIRGEAKVVSGNEIQVGKYTVRMYGVSAPALTDICTVGDAKIRCGIVAWAELIKLADGRYVSCDVETKDGATAYATCYISETDLNEALVRSGWARAVPAQTERYVVDENDAKESQRGLWSDFAPPKTPKNAKKK